ncbi:thiolase family protein [Mameliella alba]|nr:thiolase family protein [Antarctobacter heliothermus]MBY6145235.1 thiolase family protein [Mameliella alba]MCA0954983.1 thiolase family protein [Mameliella alba]
MHAYIPYGAYWSTPFARWQGEFADLHAMEFAAHVTRAALAERDLPVEAFDFAAYGLTVPQYRSFYGLPWFTGMIGAERLTGPTVNQACATGARLLATAAGEFAIGAARSALLVSGDRTSNSPHVYYPAPGAPGGTGQSEDIVLESFNKDPFARCAMVDTADNVARRVGIDTAEQHELTLHRQAQYEDALKDDRAFQKRYMAAAFAVPDARFRKTVKTISGDCGIYPASPNKMAALRPVREGGSVTFAAQTHPADGNAGLVMVAEPDRARDMATRKDAPLVQLLAFGQSREDRAHMPAAPIDAARQALERADLSIGDMDVIKSHNPFAVNDIAFARAFGIDWRRMNNFGSSLIWGHPQGPTGLRAIIEMIEELELRGGGYGLFHGCAAGDSAMALILKLG